MSTFFDKIFKENDNMQNSKHKVLKTDINLKICLEII